ncbi:MAG: NYN domain-containing protein [Anaerolineae bacterium]
MPLLIDGHNLIGQMADISLDDPDDEIRLVERLRRYHARTRKRITVIFDQGLPGGKSRPHSTHGVEVIFAPGNTSADALILRRVRRHRNPRELTVVSSDHDLAQAARESGAHAITAAAFAAQLAAVPPASAEPTLSPEEVEAWLRLFRRGNGDG